MTEVAAPRGPFGRLRVSPDGKSVVYIAAKVDGPSPHDLFLLTLADGKTQNLTSVSLDRPVLNFSWTSNNIVAATVQKGFNTNLVSIDVVGKVRPGPSLSVNPRSFDMSASMVALVGSSAIEPDELWLWDGAKSAQRVSDFNKSFRPLTILKPEVFRYKSFDGFEIEGALIKPPGFVAENACRLSCWFMVDRRVCGRIRSKAGANCWRRADSPSSIRTFGARPVTGKTSLK